MRVRLRQGLDFGAESPAFRGILSQSFGGAGGAGGAGGVGGARAALVMMLVAVLALLGACGGDTEPPASADGGHDSSASDDTSDGTEAGHESASDGHDAGTDDEHGATASSQAGADAGAGSAEPHEQALITVATQTVDALTGSDWGLVYDLSCPALLGDQSREAYVATLSAAGSPAQLAGGALSVGSPTTADGIDASELPVAGGEVRWVEMRQAEEVIGVARFVDAGDGFRYCGLTI